jgi:hypothetical protein
MAEDDELSFTSGPWLRSCALREFSFSGCHELSNGTANKSLEPLSASAAAVAVAAAAVIAFAVVVAAAVATANGGRERMVVWVQ